MPTKMVLLALAASCLAPAAAANVDLCVESACASYAAQSDGKGTCEDGAEHSEYRGVSVTLSDESTVTGAYAGQYCWAYADGGSTATGRGTSLAVSRLDLDAFQQEGVFLTWDSGHIDGEPYCSTMLHTDTPFVPGLVVPLGCPLGDAPPMLPALA